MSFCAFLFTGFTQNKKRGYPETIRFRNLPSLFTVTISRFLRNQCNALLLPARLDPILPIQSPSVPDYGLPIPGLDGALFPESVAPPAEPAA